MTSRTTYDLKNNSLKFSRAQLKLFSCPPDKNTKVSKKVNHMDVTPIIQAKETYICCFVSAIHQDDDTNCYQFHDTNCIQQKITHNLRSLVNIIVMVYQLH